MTTTGCKPSATNRDQNRSTVCCAVGWPGCRIRSHHRIEKTDSDSGPSFKRRMLFEEIIRENLDLGRPDMVQLIFDRRVSKRTPGRFRTRVLTDGVIPSLHIDYKNSRIKQYFKQVPEVREVGARTETTINNTRDFSIGKRLCNLRHCGRSAFPPTDVFSKSNASARTAPEKKRC